MKRHVLLLVFGVLVLVGCASSPEPDHSSRYTLSQDLSLIHI